MVGALTVALVLIAAPNLLRHLPNSALAADFTAKTYSVFLDGALLQTEPFVDSTALRFTDAPLVTFAANADTIATATGTAYFDDYVLCAIPEPGMLALVFAGATVLPRKRGRARCAAP